MRRAGEKMDGGSMSRVITLGLCVVALGGLAGCAPDYSPNTYSANAVQQANKVDPGVVVGLRSVDVKAAGVVGAATGAAAGGIAGAQTPGEAGSAFGAVGGALVGGLIGTSVEHAADDTTSYEYIVRKKNGDLVSVTQKDKTPLAVGTKVLVIAGPQARIVPDYTVATETGTPPADKEPADKGKDKDKPAAESPPAAAAAAPAKDTTVITVPPVTSSSLPAPAGTSAAPVTAGSVPESAPPSTSVTTPSPAAAAVSTVEKALLGTNASAGGGSTPISLLPPPTSLAPAAAATDTAAPAGTTTDH
jgi:outer membrane lipoprotein SlyB